MTYTFEQTKKSYVLDHLIWLIATWLWYKAFLFRCVGELSLPLSICIFIGSFSICLIIGMLIDREAGENGVHIFFNLVSAYGVYTIIAYFHIRLRLFSLMLKAGLILFLCFTLFFILCNARSFKWDNDYVKKYILRFILGFRYIFGFGMLCIIVCMVFHQFFGSSMILSHENRIDQCELEETNDDNTSILSLLDMDKWKTLPVEEKLDVLQVVADIERENLGVAQEIRVGANNDKPNTKGSYNRSTHEIILNIDYLVFCSSDEAVTTICHEVRHAYQHQLVNLYEQVNDDYKGLNIFDDVASYRYEFLNYSEIKKNFDDYYAMSCEVDSREYAEQASKKYDKWINSYNKK